MVDNLTTRAVLKDKLTGAATDILTKLDHTVQNLGKQKPTEAAPINYKVTHKGGALVRSGYETTTSQVHQLAVGEVVTIVELVGRRARIIAPVEGWVSTETKEGVQIMRQCHMQRKAAQNEAFEHMFEQKFSRLKAQQGGPGGYGGPHDPRIEPSGGPSRSPSPGSSPPYRSDDSDRDYDRRRGGGQDYSRGGGRGGYNDRRNDSDRRNDDRRNDSRRDPRDREPPQQEQGFVPRLAAPGSSSQGPVVLAPPGQSSRGPMGGGGPGPAAAPAAAPSASADLLSMDEGPAARGGMGSQPQQSPAFDPFGDFGGPAAPAAAAAPAPAADGFGDFDAFQASPPPRGMVGGGGSMVAPGMMPNQQMQQQMGFANPGMGWGSAPAAPMGTAPGAFPCQQQQQAGFGMGMGGMQQGQMMQGQMAQGMGMQGQMPQGQMAPNMGMAPGNQFPCNSMSGMGSYGQMPMQGGGGQMMAGSVAQQPYTGAQGANMGSNMGGPGVQVDDLMSRAMQGVANMSFEQRVAAQPSGVGQQMPMNMMGARTR